MENFRPVKNSRKHEFHKDNSRIPSKVSVRKIISSHVRTFDLFLEPSELFPDFGEFGRSRVVIHNSFLGAEGSNIRSQVHSSLSVSKIWLSTVWRCYVNVMYSHKQVDERLFLRVFRSQWNSMMSIFVFKILHDNKTFKNCISISCNKCGNFFEWIHLLEFLCLKIRVCNHLASHQMIQFLKP